MKLLQEKGLHGSGLIEISSAQLIDRYNSALVSMGFRPTALRRFSMDMMGWSPEIAKEKGNIYYLTHSLANPMGIIISINQRHAPVCFPYHSFDREMLSSFFERFVGHIMDITTTDSLCIDLDNGVSRYTGLEDLLLLDSFVMRVETPGGLITGAKNQRKLIANFFRSDLLWQDNAAREELIDSAQLDGDLRKRKVVIPDFVYADIDILYTEALGGVYILRHPSNDLNHPVFIVYKDQRQIRTPDLNDPAVRVEPISNKKLLRDLTKIDFFEMDLKVYQEKPELLEYKKELLLANYICTHEECCLGWNEMKKKNYIARHWQDIPELYFEIERVRKRLVSGEKYYNVPLSPRLIAYLTMPHKRLPHIYQHVLESLLSDIDPSDPFRLYKYNKNRFYQEYKKYPAGKKQWVAERLGQGIM